MARSIVVTGGGRGVGRSIVERLLANPAVHVVVVELDGHTTGWTADHPAASRTRARRTPIRNGQGSS